MVSNGPGRINQAFSVRSSTWPKSQLRADWAYYRWRKEYGGLKMDQARRMKELEKENARLRRAVSDLTLDKLILQEASRGNF